MIRLRTLLLVVALALGGAHAAADELRPAYLDLKETAPDEFSVLWKVPALGDRRLGIDARLPDSCKNTTEPVSGLVAGAFFERWTITCAGGLRGKDIVIDGLRATVTDVLARIQYRDSSTQIARLGPESPILRVTGAQSAWDVARTYGFLGVEHILTSLDHLLFVLALIFLIRDRWTLLKTITAFTVAHRITLAGATLGYFRLPQKPVEAAIALSIAFLASELVKMRSGERRLSESYPWIVAGVFGLLHGFGFAGALKDIGLPQADVPLALLTFNLGVEAGQILFVIAIVAGEKALSALFVTPGRPARVAAGYLIGTASTVWLLGRLNSFWS
ncbi:HupE/UreJ family protein [Rhodoblastus sp.]|jgi:hydrogenase/urease accessory protein HupE|uniref:HupE/UreJ family protein n=1 Tax=Rhodoblastus sp. TaxID=1962975 RepID=UPI0025F34203|nr:HupE/UreJ family protein [Rhodoblastus sp.]